MTRLRIVVVGGGIGGLAAAATLGQAGHDVVVLEQAAELLDVGAGIVLGRSAQRVLGQLGIADEVRGAGNAITAVEAHTATRRLGVIGPRPWRTPGLVAVHRADLLSALAARVGDVVRRSSRVDHVDGLNADLVIGADGIRSVARRFVAPSVAPRHSGVTAWRGISRARAGTEHAMAYSIGRGWEGGAASIGRRGVYWFLESRTPEGGSEVDPLALLGDLHPHLRRHIEATPTDAILRTDLFDVDPFRPWARNNVVLLGDAAHAMLPNLGQGATQALLDVVALTRALDRHRTIAPALAAYERRRRTATAVLQRGSRLAGRVVTSSVRRH